MKEKLQAFGKSLLLPISTIAAAGIFMGIAAALQNPAIVGENFISMDGIQLFIGFIRKLSGLIFGNLPIFFALSITVGLAKEEKESAAFSAILGFLVFQLTLNYILTINNITIETTSIDYLIEQGKNITDANIINAKYEIVLGFFTYRMNVFAGVIVGLVVAYLHNRFYQIQLPNAINFFGGKRFIPLITLVVMPIISVISYLIWPFLDQIISWIGLSISASGFFGPFIYGSINRLMIPTGLHHILNQLVRFTPIGGTAFINGETVSGALNIFNAAISSPTPVANSIFQLGAKYIGQGHSLIAIFGLPAAGLAMIKCAQPIKKKRVKAMILAGLAASILTGITEPIEFAFIFISPLLFVFHAIVTGLGYMILAILGTSVGGVQGGLIDFIIFGIFRGLESKWYIVLLVGIIVSIIYYYGFKYLIIKFNIITPGREENSVIDSSANFSNIHNTDDSLSKSIVNALGGENNINSITNCMTRLRVDIKNGNLIDDKKLIETGASGFVKPSAHHIQIVYGLQVEKIATNVKKYLNEKRNQK